MASINTTRFYSYLYYAAILPVKNKLKIRTTKHKRHFFKSLCL